MLDEDATINIFSGGWAVRERGFFHINATERLTSTMRAPKAICSGDMNEDIFINDKVNVISSSAYAEVALGYSHYINEQWTVGAKAKLLLGHGFMYATVDDFTFRSSADAVSLVANGTLREAGIM